MTIPPDCRECRVGRAQATQLDVGFMCPTHGPQYVEMATRAELDQANLQLTVIAAEATAAINHVRNLLRAVQAMAAAGDIATVRRLAAEALAPFAEALVPFARKDHL